MECGLDARASVGMSRATLAGHGAAPPAAACAAPTHVPAPALDAFPACLTSMSASCEASHSLSLTWQCSPSCQTHHKPWQGLVGSSPQPSGPSPGSTHLASLAVTRQGGDLEGRVQRQQAHHFLSSVARGAQHSHPDLLARFHISSARRRRLRQAGKQAGGAVGCTNRCR